jgi:hypothetical protein
MQCDDDAVGRADIYTNTVFKPGAFLYLAGIFHAYDRMRSDLYSGDQAGKRVHGDEREDKIDDSPLRIDCADRIVCNWNQELHAFSFCTLDDRPGDPSDVRSDADRHADPPFRVS